MTSEYDKNHLKRVYKTMVRMAMAGYSPEFIHHMIYGEAKLRLPYKLKSRVVKKPDPLR